jgi:Flp pilus assembly protein TadG
MRRTHRERRGANAIEFALILPVLLMLITGIMDYGYAYAVRTVASTAARTGARIGALTPQADNPDTAALTAAVAKWQSVGMPVTPTIVAFRSGDPELMVVRVRVDLASLVGLVVGPGSLEITAVHRMQDQP